MLGGAPGVYSSRECVGPGATDADRYRKLLDALSGRALGRTDGALPLHRLVLATPGGDVRTVDGACEGIIALGLVGSNGFGYDPVFYFPEQGATMAQLDPEVKNRISHRGPWRKGRWGYWRRCCKPQHRIDASCRQGYSLFRSAICTKLIVKPALVLRL